MAKRVSRARRTRRERGAVAIEAALITPILLSMILGIIEMSFLVRDHVAVSSAVRVGGRMASAAPGAGVGTCDSPCTPANAPKFGQIAADAIAQAGSAMPKDSIDEVWVYKANKQGFPGADGNTAMVCGNDCVRYKWVKASDQFRYVGGTWISKSVNACANNNPDAVGIYMTVNHAMFTGMFGGSVPLSDRAVMSFEPLPAAQCKPDTHP